MPNIDKYNKAFTEAFMIDESNLPELKYQDVSGWDSIGHMQLMSSLEEAFDIELDIDDIIDFSSYEKGKEILKKYGAEI